MKILLVSFVENFLLYKIEKNFSKSVRNWMTWFISKIDFSEIMHFSIFWLFFQEIVMPTSDKLFILHAEKHRKQKKVYAIIKLLIYGELKVKKCQNFEAL